MHTQRERDKQHRDTSRNPKATCNSSLCIRLPVGYSISSKVLGILPNISKYDASEAFRIGWNSSFSMCIHLCVCVLCRYGQSTGCIHAGHIAYLLLHSLFRKILFTCLPVALLTAMREEENQYGVIVHPVIKKKKRGTERERETEKSIKVDETITWSQKHETTIYENLQWAF